ncbi:MAG TPA: tripartite tricarboxylate transporter substrate binding protein, partial [Reyranellaceae bacterium]|nr:tripartite tricarboxylate transporter substrate binding protein [Reyranellaceae bacterium]
MLKVSGAAAVLASLGLAGRADAQAALDTLRVLVGFPPGGSTDTLSRRVAENLRGSYARTTIVENKAGAGG